MTSAPEDGRGTPPPPGGCGKRFISWVSVGTVNQVLPSGRDEAVADGQKAAIAGRVLNPRRSRRGAIGWCEGRAQESQRAAVSAWAEDGMPCKRKALFAFGADRAFPVVRVGFLRLGGKEIRRGWRYEGTAEGLAAGKRRGVRSRRRATEWRAKRPNQEGAARRPFLRPEGRGFLRRLAARGLMCLHRYSCSWRRSP